MTLELEFDGHTHRERERERERDGGATVAMPRVAARRHASAPLFRSPAKRTLGMTPRNVNAKTRPLGDKTDEIQAAAGFETVRTCEDDFCTAVRETG